MDPRLAVLDRRLEEVGRIVAVTGGKGGIGKSLVSSLLALSLSGSGRRTGLLDLDFTGPCDHVFLGVDHATPREDTGIEPAEVEGIRFLSVTCFVEDRPAPLRGPDVTNALVEILAITRWGALDVLVIDMPPGIGDAMLDCVRLLRRAEYLVVATRSRVVLETVRRSLQLLTEVGAPVLGVVENMARGDSREVSDLAAEFSVRFRGTVPYDDGVEAAIGDVRRLADTDAARAMRRIGREVLGS